MNNAYRNTRIEFHILQSFPVTCLNRDDVGAPKSAIVGGVSRARVSSQCWKRQVRMELHNIPSGYEMGKRTKRIGDLIEQECLLQGATPEQALSCASAVESIFIKNATVDVDVTDAVKKEVELDDEEGNDTLLFISPKEVSDIATAFKENSFHPDDVLGSVKLSKDKKESKKSKEVRAKKLVAILDKREKGLSIIDALDIALFGRMVAKAAEMNVEAAASFSHAISTHKVSNEVEFFTALDDLQTEPGSAHMGSLEFNSATYYRYISLDLGQLAQSLGEDDLAKAVEAFTKALFVAVPNARQTTQSGASPWEFSRVLVRRGQRLQVPFETPVKAQAGGYLQPSISELKSYLDKKEKLTGSLFGKLAAYDWGEDENFSVDDLIAALGAKVAILATQPQ